MKRYALVVGITDYKKPLSILNKPDKDAEAVAQVLKAYGDFEDIKLLKGKVTTNQLSEALKTLLQQQAVKNEALIYFTGHGISVYGALGRPQVFLATSDTTIYTKDEKITGEQDGIGFIELNDLIQESDLSSLIVLLDCCHSGEFLERILERSLIEKTLTAFSSKRDYCVITASQSFQQAYAKKSEQHSIFTTAVLNGLSDKNANDEGNVTGDRLFDLISTELKGSGQEPIRMGWGSAITLVKYPFNQASYQLKNSYSANQLSSFVSPQTYFRPLLNPDNPSNHLLFIIGRDEFIKNINNFISSPERVLILTGRGGIGKTKILHAFSQEFEQQHQNFELRFLMEGTPINNESLSEIPAKPCVVILDDAHRREDLSTLFAFAQQHSQIKLILSSRPQGIDYLKTLVTRANFSPREVMPLSEIKELTYEEVKQLAAQALGQEYAHYAYKLAAITKDSPLITVVAGRLLAERKVDPLLLERDEEFRDFILTKFQDELVGKKIIDELNPEHFKSLLRLISAVAPFNEKNYLFKKATAEFIGIEEFTLMEYIDILESKGIVVRRGYNLRITPDVLADHILHKSCITNTGIPTGYAQKIFERFKSICLSEVLQNLAELDWRIRQAEGKETNLLTDIWQSIQLEFQNASNYDRGTLLDNLNKVAYYQPRRTLELVEFAMRNPAKVQENDKFADFDDDWVRYKLPDLLQKISYTIDYLPRCCEVLWELGRNDNRDLNPNPQHAIRVLKDLAEYDPEKPIEFYQNLVRAVSRWLKAPDVHNHLYSPLDILEPLLKKSGETTYLELNNIVSRPFILNRQGIQIIRENVLNIFEECAKNHPFKSAIKAINILATALRNPEPYFNMEITAEHKEQWIPEQLHILDFFNQLVQERSEPLLHLEIIKVLEWHIYHAYSEQVRNKALEVIKLIPNTYELQLIGVLGYTQNLDWLINNKGKIDLLEFKRDNNSDKRQTEIYLAVAEEFLKRHTEADEVVQILNETIKAIQQVNTNFYPLSFIDKLTEKVEQDFIFKVCEAIIEAPQEPLANYFGYFLNQVRQININKALELAKFALDANSYNINISLAERCWFWTHNLQPDDVFIIKSLLNQNDITIQNRVLQSLKLISNQHPCLVTKIALDVKIGNSTELAKNLCNIFDIRSGISPATLKDKELATILEKLETVTNIDAEDISEFLAYTSRRLPRSVIQLFLRRIECYQQGAGKDYKPLPYSGFHHNMNGLTKSNEYEDILRDILQESLKMTYSTRFWFPKLFRDVSLGFNPTSLTILEEWINSKEVDKVETASCLLSNAPKQFVFTHSTFVQNLLDQAYNIGDKCYQQVSFDLHKSATSGGRGGLLGQPFPEDVSLKEQASAIIVQLIVGSPSYKFYSSLLEWAESEINSTEMWYE